MQAFVSRRGFVAAAATVTVALASGVLAGCGGSGGSGTAKAAPVRIGTMPTEDILPMWVAERDGLFEKAGVEAEVVVFDSAQNLSAALTAGEVDLAMTDPMRAVKLCESGTDVIMEWITLGTEPAQGRFGVLVDPKAGWKNLSDVVEYLKTADISDEWGFGVASNTVPEYVFDKLCEAEGIKVGEIPTQEVPSLPDRYSLVASGKLAGGAFPGSMLAFGEAAGLQVLADDAKGENLSQSVMVARSEFAKADGGAAGIDGVRAAWDMAVEAINADPESFRSLLIEKANLNDAVADNYPINIYPKATTDQNTSAFPPAKLIQPQLDWMKSRKYSDKNVIYNEADGTFALS